MGEMIVLTLYLTCHFCMQNSRNRNEVTISEAFDSFRVELGHLLQLTLVLNLSNFCEILEKLFNFSPSGSEDLAEVFVFMFL